jgi:hypothetical protein
VSIVKRKRTTAAKFSNIDDAVYTWYKQQCSVGVPVRGVELQAAAERFAQKLGETDFKGSTEWLFKFRQRHSIVNRKMVGESLSSDVSSVEPFRQKLKAVITDEKLLLSQIYNGDKTGLFWRAIPQNTQAYRMDSSTPGRKVNKQRLSALLCANADGSHHLTSVVVGKSAKPRAIKNIMESLPVIYKANKTAWFTQKFFSDWFFHNFVPEVRKFQLDVLKIKEEDVKALLILDNAPAHPSGNLLTSSDGKIKTMFLPPNTTLLIQPLDQGVILSCKLLYKCQQLDECMVFFMDDEEMDNRGEQTLKKIKEYSIKSAIYNWANSWNEIKISTLFKAWNKILYDKEPEIDLQGLEDEDYAGAFGATNIEDIREWLGADEDVVGYQNLTEEEIVYQMQGQKEEVGDDSDDEEDNDNVPKPTLSKVRENLDAVINFIDTDPEFQKYYLIIKEMCQEIIKKQYNRAKQSTISTFFKPVASVREESKPSTSGTSH